MTYPQSGSGYGQGDAGSQSAYGQQYGQQSGYGQQQYGQQQYGQQAGYGQQYAAQQQYGQQGYGYQQPQQPASQGLPANTTTILAAVIGALGVITLFCGFVAGFKETGPYGAQYSAKLFETEFATPYGLIAVAGVLALVTFLLGTEKWVAGVVFALSTVGALITVFQFATADAGKGAGAIILLITSILAFLAAVVWLLIEAGQIKTAAADASAAVAAPAAAHAAPAADPAASSYGHGYGQQAQQQAAQQPAAGYGQQAQASYQPGSSYGQPSATPSYGQSDTPPASDAGATTAFVKPEDADKQ
ncbi:hypothetical protein Y710_13575 [Gordonia sp. QH-12]|uniref:DUF5336 domain-containing protein n=1 Tax=Gordonia sp. QH-12 TaxID=1437876 RepID=UPI000785EFAD|nr:DUF5336 domain-containing protein [Gordonia sp. QH-12]KXT56507.1 hypothetical protein Y710_13575 [Gordonia sp. QH-12]